MRQTSMMVAVLALVCAASAGCRSTAPVGGAAPANSVEAMERALAAESGQDARTLLAGDILSALLFQDRLAEAQDRFLDLFKTEGDAGWDAFGTIEEWLLAHQENDELIRWCEQIRRSGPGTPDDILQSLLLYECEAWRREGRFHGVLDLFGDAAATLPRSKSEEALAAILDSLWRSGEYDDVERLTGYVRMTFPEREGFAEQCFCAEIELAVRTGHESHAADLVTRGGRNLSDLNLAGALRRVVGAAAASGKTNVALRVCQYAVDDARGKKRSIDAVARPWVDLAVASGKVRDVADRLSRLCALGTDNAILRDLFLKHANLILKDEANRDGLRTLLAVGGRLLKGMPEDGEARLVAMRMLDSCFLLEEYDRAGDLLTRAVDTDEKDKLPVLRNKILAHKALKEGRGEEAVRRFREFMGAVREWKRDEFDHIHGEMVPKDAILGLNSKRIGDTLLSLGDKAGAGEAHKEARRYYEAALKALKADSYWYSRVEADLMGLAPAGPGRK